MTDINELFRTVAADIDAPPSPDTVEADLARGRGALLKAHRKRTIRRSMTAATALVAGVAVLVVATEIGGGSHDNRQANHPGTHAPAIAKMHRQTKPQHQTAHSIRLVSYSGKQLQGFTVDAVPAGWRLSSSTQYALLIDPPGDNDNDPDAFIGKLAVLTSSTDEHGLGGGDSVTVNGQPGKVSDQGKYGLMLRYDSPDGFGVDVQAPAQLNWTDAQIVSFAEGVHVTGNAVHSHG